MHPQAAEPLQAWRKLVECRSYVNFADLRNVFRGIDKVGDLHVFNIGGNKFRLIAFIQFTHQICYIKAVLTHAEYDKEQWK
ncbi:type II toxin-antitoxin system HigB family toxin [Spongiibacter pelagi]